MSITDELRKFAWKECPSKFLERVIGIADDIDAEHERAVAGCIHYDPERHYCAVHGDTENGWVRLPVDADGKTIHLQDRMSWDNGTFNVHELNLTADGWTTWDELHGYTVRADQCRHVQPDSWERIIRDARTIEGCGSIGEFMERHGAELVERCKRLAGEDA